MNKPTDAATLLLLEHLRDKPQSFARDELVRAAERGRFHDFLSKDSTPKVLLRHKLLSAGFGDLAQKCVDGAYDQDREAARQWAESPEGVSLQAAALATTGSIKCRCGGDLATCETADGRAGVVHTLPTCAEFDEINDPADFLRWVRTGEKPGAK